MTTTASLATTEAQDVAAIEVVVSPIVAIIASMNVPAVIMTSSAAPATASQRNYTLGQMAVIGATCKLQDGSALTPAGLTLRIQPPTGAEIDIVSGFENPSPGAYFYAQLLNLAGVWRYRWEASGQIVGACEGALYVPVSPFAAD
jgi:hypothetical protein